MKFFFVEAEAAPLSKSVYREDTKHKGIAHFLSPQLNELNPVFIERTWGRTSKIKTSMGVSGSSGSNFCWSTLIICSQHSLASWEEQNNKRQDVSLLVMWLFRTLCATCYTAWPHPFHWRCLTCWRYCPWSPFSANCGKAMWRNCSKIIGGRLDEVLSMVSYKSRRAEDANVSKYSFHIHQSLWDTRPGFHSSNNSVTHTRCDILWRCVCPWRSESAWIPRDGEEGVK